YSVNFLNLIPIVTFIITIALRYVSQQAQDNTRCYWHIYTAVNMLSASVYDVLQFRVETPALGTWPGRMKLLGTVMCVGGTMAVSLLKGRLLHLWPTHLLKDFHTQPASASAYHNMVGGTLFLCGSCLSYALWLTVQVTRHRRHISPGIICCHQV